MEKQNAIIFGDSYSTFKGHIPENYGPYYPGLDVKKKEETWWHQVVTEANLNLVQNNSWSGSTIGYTGYNGDCSNSSSFIYRLLKLEKDGFFKENKIDVVFVFGGTNDSWANAPLGELKFDNFERDNLFSVLPAIGFFFKELKRILPGASVYCLANTDIKTEIINGINTAAKQFGFTPVNFEHIAKESGHPTVQGMIDIKTAVLKAMKK